MKASHLLSRFIRGEERKHWSATGELSDLLTTIALGVKIISSLVATCGFKGLSGYTGKVNVQGEETRILDEEADKVLTELLATSGHFGSLVSEEREKAIATAPGFDKAKYIVAFDPLDGSSNLSFNIPIGTIFAVFRKKNSNQPASAEDFLQCGRTIVAAGYAVYGSKTTFVYSTGGGVHGFTLDPAIGEFMLTDENIRCPGRSSNYSANEGNSGRWTSEVANFVKGLKANDELSGKPYSSRYVGSLVADVDRILRKGGLFLYPADMSRPDGKLRLLYECMPLAYIIEQAGGLATNGSQDILDVVPSDIHQRSPLIIGGTEDVKDFLAAVQQTV